jgi:hypothetical protein
VGVDSRVTIKTAAGVATLASGVAGVKGSTGLFKNASKIIGKAILANKTNPTMIKRRA